MTQKATNANPVLVKVLAAALLLTAGFFIIRALASDDPPAPAGQVHDVFLPNLNTGGITAYLEERGFTVERNLGGEFKSWMATSNDPGLSYTVSYGSPEVGRVQDFSAQVMVDPTQKTIEAGSMFIRSMALGAFNGKDAEAVGTWLDEHYASLGNHTDTVGAVEVMLMAPSELLRTVRLRKL